MPRAETRERHGKTVRKDRVPPVKDRKADKESGRRNRVSPDRKKDEEVRKISAELSVQMAMLGEDKWTKKLARSQQEDDLLQTLDKWNDEGQRPSWNEVSKSGKKVIYWWSKWKQLKKEHGLWWYAWIGDKHRIHWKIILPETLRGDLLKEHHEGIMSRHCGVEETYQRLVLSPYYWDHMYVSVELHCGSCDLCWQTKDLTKEAYEEASPLEEMGINPRRSRHLQHLPSV